MWESRVLRRAFERLELHEGKLSRAVLRGGGGGDVTSLPDLQGVIPGATRPKETRPQRDPETARGNGRDGFRAKPMTTRTVEKLIGRYVAALAPL